MTDSPEYNSDPSPESLKDRVETILSRLILFREQIFHEKAFLDLLEEISAGLEDWDINLSPDTAYLVKSSSDIIGLIKNGTLEYSEHVISGFISLFEYLTQVLKYAVSDGTDEKPDPALPMLALNKILSKESETIPDEEYFLKSKNLLRKLNTGFNEFIIDIQNSDLIKSMIAAIQELSVLAGIRGFSKIAEILDNLSAIYEIINNEMSDFDLKNIPPLFAVNEFMEEFLKNEGQESDYERRLENISDNLNHLLKEFTGEVPEDIDEDVIVSEEDIFSGDLIISEEEPPGIDDKEPAEQTGQVDSAVEEDDDLYSYREEELEIFYEEARDLGEQLEQLLVQFEEAPGDAELINQLNRTAHSIKGLGVTPQLKRAGEHAHKMETLFKDMLSGTAQAERSVFNELFALFDSLKKELSGTPEAPSAENPVEIPAPVEEPAAVEDTEKTPEEKPSADIKPEQQKQSIIGNTLRVDVRKLDSLMNLMGELVVSKTAFDHQLNSVYLVNDKFTKLRNRPFSAIPRAKESLLQEKKLRNAVLQALLGKAAEKGYKNEIKKLTPLIKKLLFQYGERLKSLNRESESIHAEFIDYSRNLDKGCMQSQSAMDEFNKTLSFLQREIMETRMVPLAMLFNKLKRTIRDLSARLDKDVNIGFSGEDTEIDKTIMENLADPLTHIIRNAIDHGIECRENRRKTDKPEAGSIRISAYYRGDNVFIEVSDDGAGIDPERLKQSIIKKNLSTEDELNVMTEQQIYSFLFLPGFSTAEKITDVSGRGVGLDVVKSNIANLNGGISIRSRKGEGTTITMNFPLTLAIIESLLISCGVEKFLIPLYKIEETLNIPVSSLRTVGKKELFTHNEEPVPLIRLDSFLGIRNDGEENRSYLQVVLINSDNFRAGIAVNRFIENVKVVIKPLGDILLKVSHFSGGTILGNGKVVLILDTQSILESVMRGVYVSKLAETEYLPSSLTVPEQQEPAPKRKILIVDDSESLRATMRTALKENGYAVTEGKDGEEGLELIKEDRFDLVVSDIVMPKMYGFEMLKQSRAIPGYKNTPFLLISSEMKKYRSEENLDQYVDGFLEKPFLREEFLNHIKLLLTT